MKRAALLLAAFFLLAALTATQAEETYFEKDGIRIVESDGLYGWRFQEALVQQPYFDFVSPFRVGYAIIQKNERYGIMRADGTPAIQAKWKHIAMSAAFEQDSLVFLYGEQSCAVYCLAEDRVIYRGEAGDTFLGFQEGCCLVRHAKGMQYTVINDEGDVCFRKETAQLRPRSCGVFRYEDEEEAGFTDIRGQDICDREILFCTEMKENRAFALLNDNYSSCLIDPQGNAYPLKIAALRTLFFAEGLLPVETEAGWGYLNPEGKIALPFLWKEASVFSEGLAAVETATGKWGYIDATGTLRIPAYFDNAFSFHAGRARVLLENACFFINQNGVQVGPAWEDATDYHQQRAVAVKKGQTHFIDLAGNVVLSVIGRIEQAPEYDQLWIVDGDKGSYYMDENGQAIAPYAPMAEDDFAFEQDD